ncbi:MAG: glycosyltransferase [Proteobacteria bacterium]|nr:glycosyltransferase [Pseudomonadota bacterium]
MIVFAHLLNDRSGSPKVLASAIAGLRAAGEEVRLFVGSDGSGWLDETGVPTTRYWYRRGPHRLVTLLTFFVSQFCLFLRLLRTPDLPGDAVLYVNTLLPFGAALFGRLTGRPVVYHLHEVSVTPALLRGLLVGIARLTARQLIYVSEFHRHCLPIGNVPALTVYNVLDADIVLRAKTAPPYRPRRGGSFRVLMLASLRDYKGVPEFVALATRFAACPDVTFHLVANDDEAAIKRYFTDRPLPADLTVYPRTADPAAHYADASLVVNLSRPDLCQETFGLTLLEAMAYGVPVIAPPVGGPVELVSDGREGFLVDSRNGELLAERVRKLIGDEALCLRLSAAGRDRAARFSPEEFGRRLRAVLEPLHPSKNRP